MTHKNDPYEMMRERLEQLYDARDLVRAQLDKVDPTNTEALLYKLETLGQLGDSIGEAERLFRDAIRGKKEGR